MIFIPILLFLYLAIADPCRALRLPRANEIEYPASGGPLPYPEPTCYVSNILVPPVTALQNGRDCMVAASMIPRSNLVVTFHHQAPVGAPYKLPRHFVWGNCIISLRIAEVNFGASRETTSWDEISAKAYSIITKCMAGDDDKHKRGGVTKAGKDGKISVEMYLLQPQLPTPAQSDS